MKVTTLLSTESRLGDFVVERCIMGNVCSPRWYLPRGRVCASCNGGCLVTSADFQHKHWSRVLRSVYSEVPEAPETTYDESLQTSGMNTLHTWALEHGERRFGILTRVIFQLMTALLSFCPPGAGNTDGDDHVPRHR